MHQCYACAKQQCDVSNVWSRYIVTQFCRCKSFFTGCKDSDGRCAHWLDWFESALNSNRMQIEFDKGRQRRRKWGGVDNVFWAGGVEGGWGWSKCPGWIPGWWPHCAAIRGHHGAYPLAGPVTVRALFYHFPQGFSCTFPSKHSNICLQTSLWCPP